MNTTTYIIYIALLAKSFTLIAGVQGNQDGIHIKGNADLGVDEGEVNYGAGHLGVSLHWTSSESQYHFTSSCSTTRTTTATITPDSAVTVPWEVTISSQSVMATAPSIGTVRGLWLVPGSSVTPGSRGSVIQSQATAHSWSLPKGSLSIAPRVSSSSLRSEVETSSQNQPTSSNILAVAPSGSAGAFTTRPLTASATRFLPSTSVLYSLIGGYLWLLVIS